MLNLHGKLQRATFTFPFTKATNIPCINMSLKKWLDLTQLSSNHLDCVS